MNPLVNLYRSL